MTVYLIRAGRRGPVKIGHTEGETAQGRRAEMQTGNPEKLYILRQLVGDRQLEKRLHEIYRERRIRGEWYRYCPCMFTRDFGAPDIRERPKPAPVQLTAEEIRSVPADILRDFRAYLDTGSDHLVPPILAWMAAE